MADRCRWIASVQITLTFIGSIGSGRYFDSHGARNLVVVGTTLNVLSLIATACKYRRPSRGTSR